MSEFEFAPFDDMDAFEQEFDALTEYQEDHPIFLLAAQRQQELGERVCDSPYEACRIAEKVVEFLNIFAEADGLTGEAVIVEGTRLVVPIPRFDPMLSSVELMTQAVEITPGLPYALRSGIFAGFVAIAMIDDGHYNKDGEACYTPGLAYKVQLSTQDIEANHFTTDGMFVTANIADATLRFVEDDKTRDAAAAFDRLSPKSSDERHFAQYINTLLGSDARYETRTIHLVGSAIRRFLAHREVSFGQREAITDLVVAHLGFDGSEQFHVLAKSMVAPFEGQYYISPNLAATVPINGAHLSATYWLQHDDEVIDDASAISACVLPPESDVVQFDGNVKAYIPFEMIQHIRPMRGRFAHG